MKNTNLYERKFYSALAVFTALIFAANWHHANQQGIFFGEYLPISKHLLNGDGYSIHTGINVLYPMWGYTFLTMLGELINSSIFFLTVFQFIICLIGIYFFYNFFVIEKKLWHIPLFIPFIALLSVRWPDGIVASILIIAAYTLKKSLEMKSSKYALVTGILFGVILNFRSEYIGLPIVFILIAVYSLFIHKKSYLKLFSIAAISAFIMLLPWLYYSYSIDKQFHLSATNGGGVLYISLGQLPGNPWGIVHSDSVAYAVTRANGIDDPYSPKGDSLLTAKFIDYVKSNSFAYRRKIGHNLLSSLERGVYIGEYPDLIEKSIKILFILIFDLFLAMTIYSIAKNFKKSIILPIVFTIILYKFALISLIQYEPRHMNAIYLFLLGSFFRSD